MNNLSLSSDALFNQRVRRIVAMLALSLCAAAQADDQTNRTIEPADDWSVVIGTKLWANRWSSWSVNASNYRLASRQVIEPVESDTSLSVIPQVSVRYKNVFVSTSVMTKTSYTLDQQWANSSDANRSEVDANIGYYFYPGLAFTVGIKRLTQNFGGEFKWSGPTVGLSATAGLGGGLSSYLAIGLGRMNATLASPDGAGKTSLRSDYVLSEAGLAYSIGNLGIASLNSAAITFGYRAQTLSTKGYTLNDTNVPNTSTKQNVRDTTQGFTLGFVASF